jgi:hypothetical protein
MSGNNQTGVAIGLATYSDANDPTQPDVPPDAVRLNQRCPPNGAQRFFMRVDRATDNDPKICFAA